MVVFLIIMHPVVVVVVVLLPGAGCIKGILYELLWLLSQHLFLISYFLKQFIKACPPARHTVTS